MCTTLRCAVLCWQALLAVALGLPPAYFRRLPQTNAATNILTLEPAADGSGAGPAVTLECLNQVGGSGSGRTGQARVPSPLLKRRPPRNRCPVITGNSKVLHILTSRAVGQMHACRPWLPSVSALCPPALPSAPGLPACSRPAAPSRTTRRPASTAWRCCRPPPRQRALRHARACCPKPRWDRLHACVHAVRLRWRRVSWHRQQQRASFLIQTDASVPRIMCLSWEGKGARAPTHEAGTRRCLPCTHAVGGACVGVLSSCLARAPCTASLPPCIPSAPGPVNSRMLKCRLVTCLTIPSELPTYPLRCSSDCNHDKHTAAPSLASDLHICIYICS